MTRKHTCCQYKGPEFDRRNSTVDRHNDRQYHTFQRNNPSGGAVGTRAVRT
jgi:hypothetical protein